MEPRQINITLGTAGHIDHGKTSLVKILTGCDTDRLKEEKERGMSIELGFAPCTLDDIEVGIVDVPGHENFIRTMVAGAAGIDAVLLVVAADDGVMPQTREHLDILTLLGVSHGMIALTKIDRAAPDRIASVTADLRTLTRSTFLENCPIMPISNVTGEGYDPFLGALKTLVSSVRPKSTEGVFRLPVERAFSLKGHGTVLSGIPVSGSVAVGDEVVLLPYDLASRVTSIQVYGRASDRACSGQCAALNIRHWDARAIERGCTLAQPGFFSPGQWFTCTLRLLPSVRAPFKNGAALRFHTGTSEVNASVYSLDTPAIEPGRDLLVQVRTANPIVAGPSDPFIVRSLSPTNTVGGGLILEPLPHRLARTRPHLLEDLRELTSAISDPARLLAYFLRTAPSLSLSSLDLAHLAKVPLVRTRTLLDTLVSTGVALKLPPDFFIHSASVRLAEERLTQTLADFHRDHPESAGLAVEDFLDSTRMEKPLLSFLLDRLLKTSAIAQRGRTFALASHAADAFPPEIRRSLDLIEPIFTSRPFNPPSAEELVSLTRLAPKVIDSTLKLLIQHDRLVVVGEGFLFHRTAIDRAREILAEHFKKESRFESVQFKYLLDTTRKFAIPLLDYFDKIGFTTRVGNTRFLKNR